MFLNPIWLFAAAAVVIPVAIHLWNIRPGRVLKFGSISLMQAASRKSSRSLKLLDIPLLIVRCLLLIVLALLLATPLWQKKLQGSKVKGWVLIPKDNLQACYQKFKPRIDSLINGGYEFHYFDKDFATADLKQLLTQPKDATLPQPTNYWNLVNQLDTIAPPTLPIYIFSPNRTPNFTGQKPQVALNLHWQTYIPADSTSKWIQSAWINTNGSIRVVQGNSKPSGTTYNYTDIRSGDETVSPYHVTINNGQASISLKTGDQQPIIVDTATMKIAVYADNTIDAGYLKAAVQAVSQFTQRKIRTKQYNDVNAIPSGQNWLFWLSEKPVTSKLAQETGNIFRYEKGKAINSDSWLSNSSIFSVALQHDQKISLYKLIGSNSPVNNIIWRDGFGHPVLSLQKQEQVNNYTFYSRFDPAWNDLVWRDEFPGWIMQLIIDDKTPSFNKYYKRVLDQQQIMPDIINQTHVAVKTTGYNNLSNYFWLLLALLFGIERWMANRTQTSTING